MSLDPAQMFVMNAIPRNLIAENLENVRMYCGFHHPTGPQEIAGDDDRLTDEICQKYADAIGSIDSSYSEDGADECEHTAICTALEAIGYVQEDDEDGDDERTVLLREIYEAEQLLALKRARVQQLDNMSEPDHLQTPDSAF